MQFYQDDAISQEENVMDTHKLTIIIFSIYFLYFLLTTYCMPDQLYQSQLYPFNHIVTPEVQNQYSVLIDPPDQNSQRKKRLKEFSNSLIKDDPKYIADNLYAIQIVQELTNAGLCKISNFVNGHYSITSLIYMNMSIIQINNYIYQRG